MTEQFPLGGISLLYLLLYTHIDLLPESGNARHTGRMSFLHRLLYLLRIGINNQSCTFCETQDLPPFLKDMGKRQEVQHTIVLSYWHALIISNHGSIILTTGQNNALGITRRTTRIEDIGNIIHRCRCLNGIHLCLTGEILTHLQEIIEIHRAEVER